MQTNQAEQDQANQSANGLDRRKILHFMAVTAGSINLGLFGPKTISANPNFSQIGKAVFIEASVEHIRNQQSANMPRDQIIHFGKFLDYSVSPITNQLILSGFVNQQVKKVFEENTMVMKAIDYQGLPDTINTGKPHDSLNLSVGRDMAVTKKFPLNENYNSPRIKVTPRPNNKVRVTSEGESATVLPESENKLKLASREVEVKLPNGTYKGLDDTRRNKTLKRREFSNETIPVVPEVNVVNRGKLDVYESTNGGK